MVVGDEEEVEVEMVEFFAPFSSEGIEVESGLEAAAEAAAFACVDERVLYEVVELEREDGKKAESGERGWFLFDDDHHHRLGRRCR
jgi:hypothetical protein